MATVNFPLTMKDGTKVRTLEELREHADPESIIAAFRSGKLAQWLDSLFYEDEADRISRIDTDAGNWQQQVFDILGIESNASDEVDEDTVARLNEKKRKLGQRTESQDIIANADHTALDQDDLAELLHRGISTIYLAAAPDVTYRIPFRQKNKKYVGILGSPEIKINAKNADELKANGITFENVALPAHLQSASRRPQGEISTCPHCGEEIRADAKECKICGQPISANVPIARRPAKSSSRSARSMRFSVEELRSIFESVFYPEHLTRDLSQDIGYTLKSLLQPSGMGDILQARDSILQKIFKTIHVGDGIWSIADKGGFIDRHPSMNDGVKKAALAQICQGKYNTDEVVHIRVHENRTEGWGFTIDSFCCCEGGESLVIPYEDLRAVRSLTWRDDNEKFYSEDKGGLLIIYDDNGHRKSKRMEGDTVSKDHEKIVTYLMSVGGMCGHCLDNKEVMESFENGNLLDNMSSVNTVLTQLLKLMKN